MATVQDRVAAIQDHINNRDAFKERGTPDNPLNGYKSNIIWDGKIVALIAEIQAGMQKWGHVHKNSDSMVFILEGEGEYILDGEDNTRPVRPGDVCFAPAGAIHGVHNTGTTAIRYLCVEGPGPLVVDKA